MNVCISCHMCGSPHKWFNKSHLFNIGLVSLKVWRHGLHWLVDHFGGTTPSFSKRCLRLAGRVPPLPRQVDGHAVPPLFLALPPSLARVNNHPFSNTGRTIRLFSRWWWCNRWHGNGCWGAVICWWSINIDSGHGVAIGNRFVDIGRWNGDDGGVWAESLGDVRTLHVVTACWGGDVGVVMIGGVAACWHLNTKEHTYVHASVTTSQTIFTNTISTRLLHKECYTVYSGKFPQDEIFTNGPKMKFSQMLAHRAEWEHNYA